MNIQPWVFYTIAILTLIAFSACDSAFQPWTDPPSQAELEQNALERGINPAFVDFSRSYANGEYDSYVSRPIVLSGRYIQGIRERWPDKVSPYRRGEEVMIDSQKESYAEPPYYIPDQDDCWSVNAGDYYLSDYCECIRNPDLCWGDDGDDNPSGGSSGGDDDSTGESNNEDNSDGGNATSDCPDFQTVWEDANVDVYLNAGTYFDANSGPTADGRVQFQSTSYSQVILTGLDDWCYDGDAAVSADLERITSDGSRILLQTQSDGSDLLYQEHVSVLFSGNIPQYGTTALEQTATHQMEVDVAGFDFERRNETTIDILTW